MSEIVERLTEIRATLPEAVAVDRVAAIVSGGSKRETEVR
jgi:hypothetical protein